MILYFWSSLLMAFLQFVQQDVFTVDPDQTVYHAGRIVSCGIAAPLPPIYSGPGVVASANIGIQTKWLRVHFGIPKSAPVTGWRILVLDTATGTTLDRIEAADARPSMWTEKLPTGRVRVELHALPGGDAPDGIQIDDCAAADTPFRPQSITTTEADMVNINHVSISPQIREWGASVAQIEYKTESKYWANCTGFLVGRQLLLTNQHCFTRDDVARGAKIRFGYDADPAPKEIGVTALLLNDFDLDFAVARLSMPQDGRRIARLHSPSLTSQMPLVLIHHIGGSPKMVSLLSCYVDQIAGKILTVGRTAGQITDFAHHCNSDGGSSGSPLMDLSSGDVIGLHHLGIQRNATYPANRGVQISQIIERIHAKNKPVYEEMKRDGSIVE